MVTKDPETAPGLISQNESSNEHVLSKEMSAGKNALNEFTPESIVKAITIFET